MQSLSWLLTPIVSAIIGALVAFIGNQHSKAQQQSQREDEQLDALANGMKILVRDKLFELEHRLEANGALTQDELQMATEIYQVYKALGGNHYGDIVYQHLTER